LRVINFIIDNCGHKITTSITKDDEGDPNKLDKKYNAYQVQLAQFSPQTSKPKTDHLEGQPEEPPTNPRNPNQPRNEENGKQEL
jgi:hypothetical protein